MSLDTALKRTFRIDSAESDDSAVLSVTNLRDDEVTSVTVELTLPENITAEKVDFNIDVLAGGETVELGEIHTRHAQLGKTVAYSVAVVCAGTTTKGDVDRESISLSVRI